ncbi:hypothetical protein IHE31_00310 (plasmid) [Mycetohabitans rhizoxinica]
MLAVGRRRPRRSIPVFSRNRRRWRQIADIHFGGVRRTFRGSFVSTLFFFEGSCFASVPLRDAHGNSVLDVVEWGGSEVTGDWGSDCFAADASLSANLEKYSGSSGFNDLIEPFAGYFIFSLIS